ncbi:hypothetical protein GCM10018962_20510 [Dactylosporangium matsuzakiense]|uniref:Uncharacterized protein n=1 Tax=Dactylosporangium matsuzakiense TaxID=53360 RepID=A0A9W6KLI9_9ACTN|nr:hypothetical protein GCM10017581_051380 [Dactylosporangium matsuzakiense]
MEQARHIIGAARPEDLPMARVVAEESDLGEQDGEHGRRAELPPGRTDNREDRPRRRKKNADDTDAGAVGATAAIEQAGLLHPA